MFKPGPGVYIKLCLHLSAHLCMEAEADADLPHLCPVTLRGMQVSAEAWQGDSGTAVRQEHVCWSCHDYSICHWTWTDRQEVFRLVNLYRHVFKPERLRIISVSGELFYQHEGQERPSSNKVEAGLVWTSGLMGFEELQSGSISFTGSGCINAFKLQTPALFTAALMKPLSFVPCVCADNSCFQPRVKNDLALYAVAGLHVTLLWDSSTHEPDR